MDGRGPKLGFLGAGHLASYTIAALRNGGHNGEIALSPRNAQVAARLAADFNCHIAASNQALVDGADIVIVSVRPQHLDAALDALMFRTDQIILSAVAGISVGNLRRRPGMASTILRIMPSSFIEAGDALFPLFPGNETVESLFAANGRVVVFETEEQFEMSTLASCAYAWIYELMDNLTEWFIEAGWPEDVAREMVVRHVRGATTYALAKSDTPLPDILSEIATDGTYTKAGLEHLRASDAFRLWRDALALLQSKLER